MQNNHEFSCLNGILPAWKLYQQFCITPVMSGSIISVYLKPSTATSSFLCHKVCCWEKWLLPLPSTDQYHAELTTAIQFLDSVVSWLKNLLHNFIFMFYKAKVWKILGFHLQSDKIMPSNCPKWRSTLKVIFVSKL